MDEVIKNLKEIETAIELRFFNLTSEEINVLNDKLRTFKERIDDVFLSMHKKVTALQDIYCPLTIISRKDKINEKMD